MTAVYCDVCQREFINEGAFQMHVQNSKIHKTEVKRQRKSKRAREVNNAQLPASSTVVSGTSVPRQQTSILTTFHTPPSDILADLMGSGGSSMIDTGSMGQSAPHGPGGNTTSFPMQAPTGLQFPSQNDSISAVNVYRYLQQPEANGISSPNTTQGTIYGNGCSFKYGNNHWSGIPPSEQPAALQALSESCHSPEDLLKSRYLLCQPSPDDVADLRRCKNCGSLHKIIRSRAGTDCIFHPGKRLPMNRNNGRRLYSCCGTTDRGCRSLPTHNYTKPDRRLVTKYGELAPTPPRSCERPRRQAVTLDCEMAGVRGGMSEIVLLCVADYLTSEIVMNVFIRPTIPVIDWRTTFSGVTPAAMAAATAQGQTLNGWREARRELWNHIDVDTILVGQSLQHDLDVLRMIHTRVVDSAIMARKAVDPKSTRQWGLKTLCNELLGIDIQSNGRTGHDCLEDALAAREVVLWCIQRPRQLKTWGRLWKEKEKAQKQERKLEKEKRKRLMQNSEESKSRVGDTYIGHYSNGNEVLHWSDIAEDCGWPHPDTGYDDSEVQHWSDIAEDCGWPHPDTGYDPWSD